MSEPRNHHYVPHFYLRAFATDVAKKKIATLARSGDFVVWGERSISSLGYERDLYVHVRDGVPLLIEEVINKEVETPISCSATWKKISSVLARVLKPGLVRIFSVAKHKPKWFINYLG